MNKKSRVISIILAVLTAGLLVFSIPQVAFAEEITDETSELASLIETLDTEVNEETNENGLDEIVDLALEENEEELSSIISEAETATEAEEAIEETTETAEEEITEEAIEETTEATEEEITEEAAEEEKTFEETKVEIVYTLEDEAALSQAAENEAFFTVDTTNGTVEGTEATADFEEEFGENFDTVVEEANDEVEKQEMVADYLNETGLFEAETTEAGTVEVVSVFATQRLILVAEPTDSIQAYGATDAVYFEDHYLFSYETAEAAKEAYDNLVAEYGEDSVIPDYPVMVATTGWGEEYMNIDVELKAAAKGADVTVAVLDTGANTSHKVFNGTTIVNAYNALNGTKDITDANGHGTAVAGIVAASTPSNVKVMPIKVMTGENSGSLATVINAVKYAESHGADIVSMSLGIALKAKQAFQYFEKQFANVNSMIICASGNDNADQDEIFEWPAACGNTVSVGAIDKNGNRSSFSNYGASLDFVAPGESVVIASNTAAGVYGSGNGTSFATPYVAAAAALVLAENPSYNNDQIYNELKNISVDLGAKGKDIYFGNGCPIFDEELINVSALTLSGVDSTYYYTGSDIKPSVTVKNGTVTLKNGTDYKVSYSNNKNVGTATIKITGQGSYTGTKTKTFKIANKTNISKLSVSGIKASYTYEGKAVKASITIKNGNKTLKEGTDYKVEYKNNNAIGKATVTITGKGSYTGTITKTFKVLPKSTKISSVTAATKGFTAKWAKQSLKTTGYQIQYSTNKNFKSAKTITVSNKNTVSKNITGLKAKTTYYVKVRTFTKVGSTPYYSDWSATKTVKTK